MNSPWVPLSWPPCRTNFRQKATFGVGRPAQPECTSELGHGIYHHISPRLEFADRPASFDGIRVHELQRHPYGDAVPYIMAATLTLPTSPRRPPLSVLGTRSRLYNPPAALWPRDSMLYVLRGARSRASLWETSMDTNYAYCRSRAGRARNTAGRQT